MSESLEIHVNRKRPNVLEVPESYTTDSDFRIEIVNAGKPVHLHLKCDDDLAKALALETGNHFIPREDTYDIPVRLRETSLPIRGKLKASTGYGSESRFIEVRVLEPEKDDEVTVDEQLAEPSGRERKPTMASRIVSEVGVIALIFLAVLALGAGALILATVTEAVFGVLLVVVVVAVVAGIYFFL